MANVYAIWIRHNDDDPILRVYATEAAAKKYIAETKAKQDAFADWEEAKRVKTKRLLNEQGIVHPQWKRDMDVLERAVYDAQQMAFKEAQEKLLDMFEEENPPPPEPEHWDAMFLKKVPYYD